MRKLLLLGMTIILFVACQNKPQRYFESSPEIETVLSGIAAYEAQDWDTWKANFADSARIFHNTEKASSPDELMGNFKAMLSNIESYKFNKENAITEMVVDKDDRTWVNFWSTWTGKTKITGRELSIPVHLTVEFKDGKILQEYGYYDTSSINAAFTEMAAKQEAEVAASEETAEAATEE